MRNCYKQNYCVAMPNIVIYVNCDTHLALNLKAFDLNDGDEFIFVLKNYDYINSDYVYLFRASNADMNENGEVLFRIPARASKRLKPGAFYNFAVLVNANDKKQSTEYIKLMDDKKVKLEYGTQDMLVSDIEIDEEIISAKLVSPETVVTGDIDPQIGDLLYGQLKQEV